ncbi:hypothetical protein ACFPRL_10160 [Pseudoclavibacter helvolus]
MATNGCKRRDRGGSGCPHPRAAVAHGPDDEARAVTCQPHSPGEAAHRQRLPRGARRCRRRFRGPPIPPAGCRSRRGQVRRREAHGRAPLCRGHRHPG